MPNSLKYLLIFCAASLLFFPFLGHVHLFDWDEINFAECAREMIVSKDYLRAQIDFMPFWEKPPFFIWMQVLAMKLFGVGEFAARFPNALIGVITLVTLFHAGKRIFNEKVATWWVLLYAATWLPHFYFKSGIIDPTFNLFIFLSFFQLHLLRLSPRKGLHTFLAGMFLGLAVLTKGPAAIVIAVIALVAYVVVSKGLNGYKVKHILLIGLCAAIPMLLWLGSAVLIHGAPYGKWFISEFFMYQVRLFSTEDADHGGPFYYHFIVLLFGCFPGSVFLFSYTRKNISDAAPARDFSKWMWLLFWVVLILFSIVKTKIVHYSSLCYFPLTCLAALQIARISEMPALLKRWHKVVLLCIGSLLAMLIIGLPLAGIYKQQLLPLLNDPFVAANLRADVQWSFSECIWGVLYLAGIFVGVALMNRNFRNGVATLLLVQLVIIQVALVHFTSKIEAYTQGAAIAFYRQFQGRDVYVHPLGFKSYANLFYTQKQPSTNPLYQGVRLANNGKDKQPEANEQWLLNGNIDKPAYFICKVQDSAKTSAMPQLTLVGSSNGFVFFQRKISASSLH
jgi:4-amino-4-deoxy-L-arabinose transferase-like glycosyltransferase